MVIIPDDDDDEAGLNTLTESPGDDNEAF